MKEHKTINIKDFEENFIALEVGINGILKKCPRFKVWVSNLVECCSL
jgi:hypothetical protein